MPRHPFRPIQGRLQTIEVESSWLAGNLLRDPSQRQTVVYLPPGYPDSGIDYPLIVYLGAYSGSALKKLGWRAFEESLPQRLERLVLQGRMGPVVMAFPDSFTSLGGNQFVSSPVFGSWEEYLLRDLVPRIESEFRLPADPGRRALIGFSSGGYGALFHGLRYGDSWGAIAAHSPDIGFELAFRTDLAALLTRLARGGGSIQDFLEKFWEDSKVGGEDFPGLMLLCLAGSYDPAPDRPFGLRLPVDEATCELIPERWRNWLAYDPLILLEEPACRQNLRSLKGLFLDCGVFDQYYLQYGLRVFVKHLQELAIPHFHEEFPDSHSAVEYRLDESLPYLYQRLVRPAN